MIAAPAVGDEPIWRVFLSAFHAPALVIADELGLFAALAGGPRSASALADELGVELRATETIAGVLAGLELLITADGAFELTDCARTYLLPGAPYYWGGFLRRMRENPLDYAKLAGALKRGKAAAEARVTGAWESKLPPPEILVAFTHAMHAHSFALAMRVTPRLDLREKMLDVGGGSGSYSIAATIHDATLRATVLDLPAVCAVTQEYAARFGVGDRVSTAPANMFSDPWPLGHDRVLMSDIFHDWDDERCAWLAARARTSLVRGGRVILHEMILDDAKDGPLAAHAYSMAMIFHTQGRQRSARELAALLERAGFTDVAVAPTAGGYAAISGAAP
ncbi:MAG TPA: methyltransferase [Kofleriaceae bacterium]|nr:methyltransferase [Kofleriaceae bacterium]